MMRVAIFGQSFWAQRLSTHLNLYGSESVRSCVVCLRHLSVRCLHQIRTADILMRVGFRPGADTWRGIGFDALWSMVRQMNPSARIFYYWIGTDVLQALRDVKAKHGLQRLESAKLDHHLAGAPWLSEELREIGIDARTVFFPGNCLQYSGSDFPQRFSVLTYIPDQRYRFYGAPLIAECAANLPMVHFDVIGGDGNWLSNELPNLQFWGWQADVGRFYRDCTVVMRMVEHDALGGLVTEGLAAGRHVIYSYPFPFTKYVPFADTRKAVDTLTALFTSHTHGDLPPNLAGREYVMTHFNVACLTRHLICALESEWNGRPS